MDIDSHSKLDDAGVVIERRVAVTIRTHVTKRAAFDVAAAVRDDNRLTRHSRSIASRKGREPVSTDPRVGMKQS